MGWIQNSREINIRRSKRKIGHASRRKPQAWPMLCIEMKLWRKSAHKLHFLLISKRGSSNTSSRC